MSSIFPDPRQSGPSLQHPLCSVLGVCKYADIYPSIPSHQFAKPSWVKLIWSADGCYLRRFTREDFRLFSKEVSIGKRYFCLGFREIEKEFVLIRAFAAFHNRFELFPCFL